MAAAKSRCRPLLSGSSYAGRHSNKTQQTESGRSRDKRGERVGRGWEEGGKPRPKDRRLEREKMKYRP